MSGILILAIVGSVFFVAIVAMIIWQTVRNARRMQGQEPIECAEGEITSKRQEGGLFYLTFCLSTGEEKDLRAENSLFVATAPGDYGILTFQEMRLVRFERKERPE
ncbi:MAG: DUF2500 domain-containing protein [Clostridiales bacterium]|nr:DUF2500 domain-containing protein [Clostridiales bacterium]